MTSRTKSAGAWLCLLSLSPLLAGCGASGGGYSSPEAVAVAAKAAIDKKDMGAFYDCLTEESQQVMVGAMVMAGSMMQMMSAMAAIGGPEAMAEAKKEVGDVPAVMEKHGLTEESLKGANSDPTKEKMQAMAGLAEAVKDKRSFVYDMFSALDKLKAGGPELSQNFSGELSDLKIDGDKATATLMTPRGEEELDFHKTAAGWRLHIDLEKMRANAGPTMQSSGGPTINLSGEDGAPAADPFGPPAIEEDAEAEVEVDIEK
jgi:hypothetical protein